MSRVAYVDGRYMDLRAAAVPVEDRGLQFADSVYEVIALVAGRLVDLEQHLMRLARSRGGLAIPAPMTDSAIRVVLGEIVRRNKLSNGLLYMQVTRGQAPRNHLLPARPGPSLMVTLRPWTPFAAALAAGVSVASSPDLRWRRCDLKTTGLLANVLAKQQAHENGAFECWMVSEGVVTEGASSNAWIVRDGYVQTHPLGPRVLGGITRELILELAAADGIKVVERGFSPDEVAAADEAFNTSTSSFIVPVITFDGKRIGTGRPGPVTCRLRDLYRDHVSSPVGSTPTGLH